MLTHGGHQRCSLLCGLNRQARRGSSFRERHHRRGSHAGFCGHRCGGQLQSRRSRIWGEPGNRRNKSFINGEKSSSEFIL